MNQLGKALLGILLAPLFALNSEAQTTLNPVADTTVIDGSNAGSNFGNDTTLRTKNYGAGNQRRAFLKFDVSAIGTVTSAKIRLYGSSSGTLATAAYSVADDTWTETGVTWNTQPAAGTLLNSVTVTTTAQYWEWDVTSFVKSEKSAGQNLVTILFKNDSNGSPSNIFQSREATSNKPQLLVNGTTTTNPSPTVSLTSPANGTTYSAPGTVAISASATDSNGTVSKVEFLAGNTLIATDTASPYAITWNNVAAGTYSLTGRATDNGGAISTSSTVNISVGSSSSSSSSGGNCGNGTGPTDNPIATKYGTTAYPWTANIKWNCVYNINNYSGADNVAKFNAARDAAAANGGGVVYFPTGDYTFNDNLVLKSGVVIRGASTTADAKSARLPGALDPTTNFIFPDREHKGIFNNSATDANMGVVNIDSDGGAIMLWPALTTTGGTNLKQYWWVATNVVGMGSNKVVFGNRVRNVVYKQADPNNSSSQPWAWRFSTAIAVYSDANALVANNLIGQTTKSTNVSVSFTAQTGCAAFSGSVALPYDNRYGIDVNRILLGGVIGSYVSGGKMGSNRDITPTNFPWYYRRGLAIRDNYVYMNGRVGISWSGQGDGSTRGSGTQVLNNHVEIKGNSTLYTVDGNRCAGGQSTNENRGYDQSGFDNRVDGNTGTINRQKPHNTSYWSTDGEGILHQAVNSGNWGRRNVWNNNNTNGGQSGYMLYYKLLEVTDNTITGNTPSSNDAQLGALWDVTNPVRSGNNCSGNSAGCVGL